MPTISVDKQALFKELGKELVLKEHLLFRGSYILQIYYRRV